MKHLLGGQLNIERRLKRKGIFADSLVPVSRSLLSYFNYSFFIICKAHKALWFFSNIATLVPSTGINILKIGQSLSHDNKYLIRQKPLNKVSCRLYHRHHMQSYYIASKNSNYRYLIRMFFYVIYDTLWSMGDKVVQNSQSLELNKANTLVHWYILM